MPSTAAGDDGDNSAFEQFLESVPDAVIGVGCLLEKGARRDG